MQSSAKGAEFELEKFDEGNHDGYNLQNREAEASFLIRISVLNDYFSKTFLFSDFFPNPNPLKNSSVVW